MWFTGAKQGAIDDINFVRVNSGGLAPTALTTGSTDDQFITELLNNRRYSLFFEFGHRWWDTRRFNRLGTRSTRPSRRIRSSRTCHTRLKTDDGSGRRRGYARLEA